MNKIVVITAPSGAGKTTVVKKLLSSLDILSFSISATTREKRDNETEGVDYHFFTHDEFRLKISNDEFIEWEEVYPGKFYGTLRSVVNKIWKNGKVAIFDIDVAGALQIKKMYQDQALTIFIMPPSLDTLLERLKKRNTEEPEDLMIRIEKASREMDYMHKFDRIILNDYLDRAVTETAGVILKWL